MLLPEPIVPKLNLSVAMTLRPYPRKRCRSEHQRHIDETNRVALGCQNYPMTRLVAFLGGINVGGHRVTMDRLRAEFGELGFTDVETFIASGNVLFEATTATAAAGSKIEERIENHLHEQLGWPVPTFVRKASEVVSIIKFAASNPFGAMPHDHTHMVALTKATIDAAQRQTIVSQTTVHNRFLVQGRDVHWLIDGRMSDSTITLPKLTKWIGRNTTRNISSLTRLCDRL